MRAIWQLIYMCIIPIMTYGAEAAAHTKKEEEEIQQIFNNLLKRLLDLPQSTPNSALLVETGYLPMECYMDRKRIMQAHRVINDKKTTLIKKTIEAESNEWLIATKEKMEKYNITMEDLNETKNQLKEKIIKNQTTFFEKKLNDEKTSKSKVRHLLDNKPNPKLGQRPKYMKELTRKQCRTIALTRTRMIPVKANHKGSYPNQECRWCKIQGIEETQEHIMNECEKMTKETKPTHNYQEIFDDNDTDRLREIAETIKMTIEIIMEENQSTADTPKNKIVKTNQQDDRPNNTNQPNKTNEKPK